MPQRKHGCILNPDPNNQKSAPMCDAQCQQILGGLALLAAVALFLVVLVYMYIRAYIEKRNKRKLEAEQEIQLQIYQGRRHPRSRSRT